MKILTKDLTERQLEWAVAKTLSFVEGWTKQWVLDDLDNGILHGRFNDWVVCGPLIERERIWITYPNGVPTADMDYVADMEGPTPLVAAMRCFVASRLGDEVDVPEGLM